MPKEKIENIKNFTYEALVGTAQLDRINLSLGYFVCMK